MNHPDLSDPRNFVGALRDLGDDKGRPLARTPEEQLAQFRVNKRRRRAGQLAVAAVAAFALVGGGVAVAGNLTRGTAQIQTAGEGQVSDGPLGKVYLAMRAAGSARVNGLDAMVVLEDGEKPYKQRTTGLVDLRTGDSVMTAEPTAQTLGAEVRRVGKSLYVKTDGTNTGTAWTERDVADGPFLSAAGAFEAVRSLATATQVKRVGAARIDGVDTVHYTAAITLDQLIAMDKAKLDGAGDEEGLAQPVIDVWVDEQNRVRRLSVPYVAGQGQKPSEWLTLEFSDFGVDATVQKPPTDQTSKARQPSAGASPVFPTFRPGTSGAPRS